MTLSAADRVSPHSSAARDRAVAIAVAAMIVGTALLVHGLDLPATWDADDGFLLEFAVRYSPLQYFFIPAYTHGLSPANLQPWLALAYDVDLALFGLAPQAFYAVQVAAIAIAALLAYLTMRLWLPRLDAAAAALLFLLGATTQFAAKHLMVAHYVDGLAFALFALFCYVRALRSRHGAWLIASAAAYALALTCKELYVPLPLVMLALPERDWRTRVRSCSPHLALLVLYALWRRVVLGSFVGGYASAGLSPTDIASALQTLGGLPTTLLGHGIALVAAAIVVVLVGALAVLRRRVNVGLLLVVTAVVVLPLVPLGVLGAISAPDRFFFALWFAFVSALAWAASATVPSTPLRTLCYVVVGVAAYANLAAHRAEAGSESDLSRIYAFVLDGKPGDALAIDGSTPYLNNQLNGLLYAYRTLAPGHPQARVVAFDALPELADESPLSLFTWSAGCRCVVPMTADAQRLAVRSSTPAGLRASPAVDIEYDARDRTMRWKAGPYTDGTWTIRFETAPGLWAIKYDTWRRTGGANIFWPDPNAPFRFFVRFESAQGWTARTPLLTFTPASEPRLSWAPPR